MKGTTKTNTKVKTVTSPSSKKLPPKERIKQIFKKPNDKFLNVNQSEYWKTLDENEITLCFGPAGVGKAQPMYSNIITPKGLIKMGDIKIGDEIFDNYGSIIKVIDIIPQGEMDIYEITFSDGVKTRTTTQHLWYTETSKDRNHRVKVNNKRFFKPKSGSVKELSEIIQTLVTNDGRKNHSIPVTKPLNFSEQNVTINPYVLGVLIGDGGLTTQVRFTTEDEEIVDNLRNFISDDVKINKLNGKFEYSIVSNRGKKNIYRDYLNEIGLFGKKSDRKFIPKEYLYNTLNNRVLMLQGLLDTDGYINKNGSMFYYTSSKQLKDDVVFLVNSLGGVCYVNYRKPTYIDKKGIKKIGVDCYSITINLPNEIKPFKLTRKLERWLPKSRYQPKRYITDVKLIGKEICQCISVGSIDGLYLTDNCIVTHNSFISMKKALDLLQDENNKYEKILIVRPAVEAEEKLGSLPGDLEEKLDPYLMPSYKLIDKIVGKENRLKLKEEGFIEVMALAYLRGWNVDNTILIFEEAQNSTPNQMKLLLTRIGFNSKFFISGDLEQSDKFKDYTQCGLYDAKVKLTGVKKIGVFEFDKNDIVRNPLISQILEKY